MSFISSFSCRIHMTFGTAVSKAVYWYNCTVATPSLQFTSSFSPFFVTAQHDSTVLLCVSVFQGLGVHKLNSNV